MLFLRTGIGNQINQVSQVDMNGIPKIKIENRKQAAAASLWLCVARSN
jgi:hypothetical protein